MNKYTMCPVEYGLDVFVVNGNYVLYVFYHLKTICVTMK